jgi:hypothetical protein
MKPRIFRKFSEGRSALQDLLGVLLRDLEGGSVAEVETLG